MVEKLKQNYLYVIYAVVMAALIVGIYLAQ